MAVTQRGRGLTIAGILVALVGIAAGVALWFVAAAKVDDAVEGLAPAPVGCDTTLDFDRSGTFFVYAETTGEVGALDGDCENDDKSYEGSSDAGSDLDVTLFDGDENEVELTRDRDVSYDAGGASGTSLFSVEIDEPGEYTLRVQGEDSDVVARVGSDPNDGVTVLRGAAIAALVAGVVLGVLFIVLGRRRRRPTPDVGADGGWGYTTPTGPPGAPPYQPTPGPPAGGWGPPPTAAPPPPSTWRPPSG